MLLLCDIAAKHAKDWTDCVRKVVMPIVLNTVGISSNNILDFSQLILVEQISCRIKKRKHNLRIWIIMKASKQTPQKTHPKLLCEQFYKKKVILSIKTVLVLEKNISWDEKIKIKLPFTGINVFIKTPRKQLIVCVKKQTLFCNIRCCA